MIYLQMSLRMLWIMLIVVRGAIRWRLAGFLGADCEAGQGRVLYEGFQSLGGAFPKIGQLLSTRPDLLGGQVAASLVQLQDRLPPFSNRLTLSWVAGLVKVEAAALLAAFDPVPIAAASVAQVHRARLRNGQEVVLKIRRPHLSAKVEMDVRLVAWLARVLGRLGPLRVVPLESLMREFGDAVRRQLDFRDEAQHHSRFKANFGSDRRVKLPNLVAPLCSEAVLAMEFIPGLHKVETRSFSQKQRQAAARAAVRMLFQMVFVDGFVHCDLHPGNLFFREDGEMVLLDFGFVAELSEFERLDFRSFFAGIALGDGLACAEVILKTAIGLPPGFEASGFCAAMKDMIARHHALSAQEFEVARFAVELFDLQRRFRITGSTRFTMTITAFLVLEGIVKQLYPQMDFQGEALGFFATLPVAKAGAG